MARTDGRLVCVWLPQGAADLVRHAKLSDVVVADYAKDPAAPARDGGGGGRRRSSSRDRVHARRDSLDSVSFEKSEAGEEVSMGAAAWHGDGVSMRVPRSPPRSPGGQANATARHKHSTRIPSVARLIFNTPLYQTFQ